MAIVTTAILIIINKPMCTKSWKCEKSITRWDSNPATVVIHSTGSHVLLRVSSRVMLNSKITDFPIETVRQMIIDWVISRIFPRIHSFKNEQYGDLWRQISTFLIQCPCRLVNIMSLQFAFPGPESSHIRSASSPNSPQPAAIHSFTRKICSLYGKEK